MQRSIIKIVLIGTGGVATNLGKLFARQSMAIEQILGRSQTSTRKLAESLNCSYTLDPSQLSKAADLYIIAVQDREIAGLLSKLHIPETALIVHTAGGVSMDVFTGLFKCYGVLYPLQSLRKETTTIPEIPFYLDGNNAVSKSLLENIAIQAGLDYRWANDRQRMQLHVAAVLCSNYPNYLFALTERFCQLEGLDFNSLLPVITETSNRLAREGISPASLQTGPAVRQDLVTVNKHLQLLKEDSEIRDVYQYLAEKITGSGLFKDQMG